MDAPVIPIAAAGRSLSAATARAFHAAGARVLVGRSPERLHDPWGAFSDSRPHALAGNVGLSNPASLAPLTNDTLARGGGD